MPHAGADWKGNYSALFYTHLIVEGGNFKNQVAFVYDDSLRPRSRKNRLFIYIHSNSLPERHPEVEVGVPLKVVKT